ncbi:MAG: NifU N-terminal domain-containing protein [Acidimicrobiales bacterium]
MASASPSPTPNPNAMKFTLDTKLAGSINYPNATAAAGNAFAVAVFAGGGVASLFGVNDFVTVTRSPGADWPSIIDNVKAAAAEHL